MEVALYSLLIAFMAVAISSQKIPVESQKAAARNASFHCENFVQTCTTCQEDGNCYCSNTTKWVDMKCNKWNQNKTGCFEIFDPENKTFGCKLDIAHVTNLSGNAVQFCRTFTNSSDLLNANYRSTRISSQLDYYISLLILEARKFSQQTEPIDIENNNFHDTINIYFLSMLCFCAAQTILIVVLIIMNCKNANKGVMVAKVENPAPQEAPAQRGNIEYQFENDIYGKI